MPRWIMLWLLCGMISACAPVRQDFGLASTTGAETGAGDLGSSVPNRPGQGGSSSQSLVPQIVSASMPLQCVPYAREISGIPIRGDAWTWWQSAEGRFRRSRSPAQGAVLVLNRQNKSRGHLAVVTEVLNSREIVVEHANWLNRGRIHRNTPVKDVSPGNDWSAVRVWYTPGATYGKRVYTALGFIHPEQLQAQR